MIVLSRKKKISENRLQWRKEGKEKFEELQKSFHGFSRQLQPYKLKKDCLQQLLEINSCQFEKPNPSNLPVSRRILDILKPVSKWAKNRCTLIRRKFSILRGIRGFELPTIEEVKATCIMSCSLYKNVPIGKAQLETFRSAFTKLQNAKTRMDLIQSNIVMCQNIPLCTSMLHSKHSGCPRCGVVYIGGSSNLVQYVRSVDRTSGVPTLVRLEFEIENLKHEDAHQKEILEICHSELELVRVEIFQQLVIDFQTWFSARQAMKKSRALLYRLEWSKYFFRIRRLAKMKRDVDSVCVSDLDLGRLYIEYSEISNEVLEYVSKKQRELNGVVQRVARQLLTKLRTKILRSRKRKLRREQREIELQNISEGAVDKRLKDKNLRLLRKRVDYLESRKWTCVRAECNMRRFLSEDRYLTHMSIHKQNDAAVADDQVGGPPSPLRLSTARAKTPRKPPKSTLDTQHFALEKIGETRNALQLLSSSLNNLFLKDTDSKLLVPVPSSSLPHLRSVGPINSPLYHLELLSKTSLLSLRTEHPTRIPISLPLLRVGTLPECEISIDLDSSTDSADIMISRIHCMIFYSTENSQILSSEEQGGELVHERPSQLTLVDNSSYSGTYVISTRANGTAVRVPVKATAGMKLYPGDLICIGVDSISHESTGSHKIGKAHIPPPTLTALEAGSAALVFKVRCFDMETHMV